MAKRTSLSGRFCVHLVRHAHAGDSAAWQGDDALRPLSEKGVGQATRLGLFLAERGIEPDLLVTSPLLRARQTCEILADKLSMPFVEDARLASEFSLVEVAQILLESGARAPLMVGHNPDFSHLLAHVLGCESMPFKKGALASVDLHADEAGGSLRWLVPPKLLRGL